MSHVIGAVHNSTELYLPTYELGEHRCRLSETSLADADSVAELLQEGVNLYRTTCRDPWQLSAGSISQALTEAAVHPKLVDVLLYATNTFWDAGFSASDMTDRLLDSTGMERAFPIGVHLARCANSQVALHQGASLAGGGEGRTVVVTSVDKVRPGDSPLMEPPIAVRSDAAASVVLRKSGSGGAYAVLGTALVAISRPYPPGNETYLGRVAGMSTALQEIAEWLLSGLGVAMRRVDMVLTNNYRPQGVRSLAKALHLPVSRLYFENIARFGHALSSDTLINLRDYTISANPREGTLVVLLADGPHQWAATVLQRLPT